MHRLFKYFSIFCAIICSILYLVIFIGEIVIPDHITVIDNEEYIVPDFFGMQLYSFDNEKQVGLTFDDVKPTHTTTEIKLLNIIPVKNTKIINSKRQYVVIGGGLFGIKLYTDGVIIVDFDDVESESGLVCPGEESGMKIGDIVKSVNGETVISSAHFSRLLQESKGKEINITLLRKNKTLNLNFKTIKEKESGKYKAGLWVRDSTAGLGTITFYNTNNNTFAGLGHPIYDVDTNEIMPMKTGVMAEVKLNGLNKSSFGNVGELCGIITGEKDGFICLNDETGIYGYSLTNETDKVPIAVKQEIKQGKAQIRCTVNNSGPQYYDVEIVKIFSNSASVNKDMIIKIIDNKLLSETGGIVQGMSGSPIIQDGKLVGAVTHVFVNNPKQGYAIFAERMLETSNTQDVLSLEEIKNAS